jgi:glycogen operon protein
MQWNAAYRDTIQSFVRGDKGMVPDLMTRIYGSCDLFPDDRFHALRPFQSVNYITSHDGFTLADLVSFNHKRNYANGHNNLDGHDDRSWNCGWEGNDDTPLHVAELRKQQVRNFFMLLMLSNGIPMFRMGDEFLNSQEGNNNPFNQDNEISWLDWDLLKENREIFRFFKMAIAFRKAHPSISRSVFWRDDIHWYGQSHSPDLSKESRQIAWCLHGGAVNDDDIYVMVNAADQARTFGIQEGAVGDWLLVADTSQPSPLDIVDPHQQTAVNAAFYNVHPRSVVVLRRPRTRS